jgi:hypothetical protein
MSEGEALASDINIAVLTMFVFAISDRYFLLIMTATPSGCIAYCTASESVIPLGLLSGYKKYSELTCN